MLIYHAVSILQGMEGYTRLDVLIMIEVSYHVLESTLSKLVLHRFGITESAIIESSGFWSYFSVRLRASVQIVRQYDEVYFDDSHDVLSGTGSRSRAFRSVELCLRRGHDSTQRGSEKCRAESPASLSIKIGFEALFRWAGNVSNESAWVCWGNDSLCKSSLAWRSRH